VLAELAESGRMELATLRDRQGRIRDFEWLQAGAAATLRLGCPGADLVGTTLRGQFADDIYGDTLFLTYQRAVLSRRPQVGPIDLGGCVAVHHVAPTPMGVVVVLTSPSAAAKVVAAQRELRTLETFAVRSAHGRGEAVGAVAAMHHPA
jgi:hypothetical protein